MSEAVRRGVESAAPTATTNEVAITNIPELSDSIAAKINSGASNEVTVTNLNEVTQALASMEGKGVGAEASTGAIEEFIATATERLDNFSVKIEEHGDSLVDLTDQLEGLNVESLKDFNTKLDRIEDNITEIEGKLDDVVTQQELMSARNDEYSRIEARLTDYTTYIDNLFISPIRNSLESINIRVGELAYDLDDTKDLLTSTSNRIDLGVA